MLDLYIDFKCPQSYLALKPTLALAEEKGLKVNWLPFNSRQSAVPTKKEGETKGETHRRVRAEQRQATDRLYADVQGIGMHFRNTPGETVGALALLVDWPGDPDGFMQSAFEAYWTSDADLDDAETVLSLARSAGREVSPEELAEARKRFAVYEEELQEKAIFAPATYCLKDQTFVGRQHLPLIRALINQ